MEIKSASPKLIPPRNNIRYYPVGKILGEYFYLSDKPGGVEPGFLAVKTDSFFKERLAKSMPDIFYPQISDEDLQEKMEQLIANPDLAKDYNRLLDFAAMLEMNGKNKLQYPEALPLWLIKQDYNDSDSGKVSPPSDRLQKTNAIQSLPKLIQGPAALVYKQLRLTDPVEENNNAILEYFANSVAKAYGMQVQNQELAFGEYANGMPKIMTACCWEPALEVFNGKVKGSLKRENYEGYLVKEKKTKEGYFQAEDSVIDLGIQLALIIAQADRDVLGSQGQNKGRVGAHFFGFDFGHAYREENLLLSGLKSDFSFEQPEDPNKKYKHISCFYDSTLTDKISGLFLLYAMDKEKAKQVFSESELSQIEKNIRDYQEKDSVFAKQYSKVEGIDNVYQRIIEEMAMMSKYHATYPHYLATVELAYQRARNAHEKMFQLFKQFMLADRESIDLMDNLNKLSNPTSILSSDQQVILNHLRLLPQSVHHLNWQVEKTADQFSFKAQPEDQQAMAIYKLKAYISWSGDSQLAEYIQFSDKGLVIAQEHLAQVNALFNEDKMIHFKTQIEPEQHPKLIYAEIEDDPTEDLDVTSQYRKLIQKQISSEKKPRSLSDLEEEYTPPKNLS